MNENENEPSTLRLMQQASVYIALGAIFFANIQLLINFTYFNKPEVMPIRFKNDNKTKTVNVTENTNKITDITDMDNVTRRILYVTAHPDDEVMFFSPSILNFVEANNNANTTGIKYEIHLLCLCNGNSIKGQGPVREKELIKSCKTLGIDTNRVTIINDEE